MLHRKYLGEYHRKQRSSYWCGWANSGHMVVYQQHPQVKLVGVCDIDPLRAEKSAKTFGA